MEFLGIWIIGAVIAAAIAASKHRNFVPYFLMGLLCWPVVIVVAILAKPNQHDKEERDIRSGERIRCPHCAELIRTEATVCRFCTQPVASATRHVVGGVVIRE